MASSKQYGEEHRRKSSEIIDAAKSGGCVFCGEAEPVCLDFHHVNPGEKDFAIGAARMTSHRRLIAEIAKCIVVCANCHRKLHAGILSL